jgi:hypothetical protein
VTDAAAIAVVENSNTDILRPTIAIVDHNLKLFELAFEIELDIVYS